MKYDIVLGGVGGQGILSIAFVIDNSAMKQGLRFKQSEVHGMAQRGGAVSSHLRVSDQEIFSDLVGMGQADMLLSVEPMEALRYRDFLAPGGVVVSSTHPEKNIPDYPDVEALVEAVDAFERRVLFNGGKIAREAGSPRCQNMVAVGAASPLLPLEDEVMEGFIELLFVKKSEKLVRVNLNAFRYGRANGQFFTRGVEAGAPSADLLLVMDHLASDSLILDAAPEWAAALAGAHGPAILDALRADPRRILAGDVDTARRVAEAGAAALEAEA
jgi:indolepyruvate ferredoxin oxidoreductase, beta subunit